MEYSFTQATITVIALAATGCAPDSTSPDLASERAIFGNRGHAIPIDDHESRIQINPDPNPPDAPPPHLNYYGGKVIQSARVIQVLYGSGSYIPELTSTSGVTMASAYTQMLRSGVFRWLSEYNTTSPPQTIGEGSFGGTVQIAPAASHNGSTINDASIQAELLAQISAGTLPPPSDNHVYMVHFPSGHTVIDPDGTRSCVARGFCAYHGTFKIGAQNVYYGVLPDIRAGKCATGCGPAPTAFQNQTSIASHELVEAITDPEIGLTSEIGPPLAWYDPLRGEIGDMCLGQQFSFAASDMNTYTLQKEWSNLRTECTSGYVIPSVFDIWAANPDAHAVSGDFDGDGRSDIALVGGDDWTTVPVAFSRGDGTFTVTNGAIGEFAVWANAPGVKIVTGDVNGDGRTDIVLTGGPGWWTIPVAFSNGDGTFNVSNQSDPWIPGIAQVAGVQVVAGDVNGDGRADLILTGGAGWSTIPVAFSNGNGTYNATNAWVDFFPGWAQNPYAKASATDVNGDGRADVILTSGADWVTVPMALSNGDGTFTVSNQLDSYIPIWSQGIGAKTLTGDLNGDRRGDIILAAGADWVTIPTGFSNGNGTLTVANPIVPAFPIWAQDPSAQAVSGDFDHDGFADIALVGGNGWFTVPIAYSNGNGTFRVTNYPVY